MAKQVQTESGRVMILPKIAWWGQRAGGYYEPKTPKGSSRPWGLVVKLRKWKNGAQNSGPSGKRAKRWYWARAKSQSGKKVLA